MLTLLDVDAIIGIQPTGDVFDPIQQDKCTIIFSSKRDSYIIFIADHFETQTKDVLDEKHIAFLTL